MRLDGSSLPKVTDLDGENSTPTQLPDESTLVTHRKVTIINYGWGFSIDYGEYQTVKV